MKSDHYLVHQFLLDRSETSFLEIYRSLTPALYSTALRLTSNDIPVAEDLVQDVWIVCVQKIENFQFKSAFKTWLTGILINISKKRFSTELHSEQYIEEKNETIVSPSQNQENTIDIEKALESLPLGYRKILVLHDIEGYKHREIAEMFNISAGTSKSQLYQARKALKKKLEG